MGNKLKNVTRLIVDLTGIKTLNPEYFNSRCIDFFVFVCTQFIAFSTPVAFAVGIYIAFNRGLKTNIDLALAVWSTLEIYFYFYCWMLYSKLSVTNPGTILAPERKEKLKKVFIEEGNLTPLTLSKWFNPIRKDLVTFNQAKTWLAWAFFGKHLSQLSSNEKTEVDFITKGVESKHNIKFPETETGELRKPMLLTLDPVIVQHKPLLFYGAISLIQASAATFLLLSGFQPNHLSTGYTYWIYEPANCSLYEPPIFFVHGIGIGVSMYSKKIYDLLCLYPNRKIILLELPYISLTPVTKVHTMEETINAVDEIFSLHNISSCSFIGHSYGTIVCGWVMKHRVKYVSKMTLVDPVCFAMWEPELTRNFVYSKSTSLVHRMCQFFVSRDLFIANTIGRNFFWYNNVLLAEEICKPTKVYLSKYDFIINAPSVYKYLQEAKAKNPELLFKAEMVDEQTHGTYLISKEHSKIILSDV